MTAGVRLRPATQADAGFLLDLRNEPEVRRQSRNEDTIEPDRHEAWLAATLADERRHLYVIEADGRPVGQLRLDCDPAGEAEVSLALVPAARGRGTGGAALAAARRRAAELGIRSLLAAVRSGNSASLAAFAREGYVRRDERDGWVVLTSPVADGG